MGAKKEVEAMGLEIMRERFRLAAKSSVVNWEPHEIAEMALTLEKLAEVRDAVMAWRDAHALKLAHEVKP